MSAVLAGLLRMFAVVSMRVARMSAATGRRLGRGALQTRNDERHKEEKNCRKPKVHTSPKNTPHAH